MALPKYTPPTTAEREQQISKHLLLYLKNHPATYERVNVTGPARAELGWLVLELGKALQYMPGGSRELETVGREMREAGLRIIEQGKAGQTAPGPSCPLLARLEALERDSIKEPGELAVA